VQPSQYPIDGVLVQRDYEGIVEGEEGEGTVKGRLIREQAGSVLARGLVGEGMLQIVPLVGDCFVERHRCVD
jgi:hypothetical protein